MTNRQQTFAGFLMLALLLVLVNGCTVVSADRVFPKLDWYWGRDAKLQREGREELKRQSLERKLKLETDLSAIDPRTAMRAVPSQGRSAQQQMMDLLAEIEPADTGRVVTVSWTYPQFYQTWGTSFAVMHSQDLKGWTVLTNVTLPTYSKGAVWTHTNDDFAIVTPMLGHDFFKVGVRL